MSSALVWFRRDLRCFDHAALHHGLKRYERVYCAFVFDTAILDPLPSRDDRRVAFIRHALVELDAGLDRLSREAGGQGSGLLVRHGAAVDEIPWLAAALGVQAVFANRDDEPAALRRDHTVAERLAEVGIDFADFKDSVIFERDQILTRGGTPYSVFTPYRNAWLKQFAPTCVQPLAVAPHAAALAPKAIGERIPELAEIGFGDTDLAHIALPLGMSGGQRLLEDFLGRIDAYQEARDYPARRGVSYLSAHLRFGTVSVRELVGLAWANGSAGAQTWLSELVWRDFYHMILWHHPRVEHASFRAEFDVVRWDDAPALFAAWCEARTGYPLIDAAMRQLHASGYMHNRLRMVTASFLTKDLGIDWRLGERHFAQWLLDYDLAANNGGWQWAASTGCDAQPWFRIFNPVTQSERFDPGGRFIRRYLPELAAVPDRFIHAPWTLPAREQAACGVEIGRDYPLPVVDHARARERTLARFAAVRGPR